MERVLYNLHSNVCSIGLRRTSSKTRRLAEHSLLLIALCGFGVLVISHISFVHRPVLEKQQQQRKSIPMQCLSSIEGFQKRANVTHVLLWDREESNAYSLHSDGDSLLRLECNESKSALILSPKDVQTCSEKGDGDTSVCQQSPLSLSCPSVPSQQDVILSYSPIRGFLFLPHTTSLQHNVSSQYVFISKTDVHCFGEPFLQFLVHRLLGVETVAFHWLMAHHSNNSTGYIYNPKTRQVTNLNAAGHYSLWKTTTGSPQKTGKQALLFKAGVILTSVFLFFITTTLVSFTLRETQDRMLQFTFQLQMYVEQERRLGNLITKHVVENLVFVPIMVGVMFFLIEFYGGDKLLAFMVMSIVWVCEVFSTIAIRSIQGMQFFPKIFFLLFILFHVYFFSCPFGFCYMALASTAIFMLHSMYFFWHRYELPAVAHGLVNIDNPRMSYNTGRTSQMDHIMVPLLSQEAATDQRQQQQQQQQQQHRLHLPPRNPILRGQSHPSMSSLGRNSMASRPSSSTGLPFHGDDDGDGSESYMYFMDGEVVMHRERNTTGRSPSISTHGSLDNNESSSMNEASAASSSNPTVSVPQRIVASPAAIAHATSATSEMTVPEPLPSPSPTRRRLEAPGISSDSPIQPPQNASTQVDTDLTPRIGTTGSHEVGETQTANSGAAPLFPMGVFRRTSK